MTTRLVRIAAGFLAVLGLAGVLCAAPVLRVDVEGQGVSDLAPGFDSLTVDDGGPGQAMKTFAGGITVNIDPVGFSDLTPYDRHRSTPDDAWSQGAGPFAALHGSWSGSGSIRKSNGGSERIRCRSAFEPSSGATSLSLRIRCASDSYNIDLTASVASQGGSFSGSWQEATRSVGGNISGQ